MKNVDKKDEALNKLFSGYIEEAECPPEGVTFMAKEAMDENTVRERATELQLAAQTSHGGEQASGSGRRIPAKAYAVIAALFVLVAAVLLAVLLHVSGTDKFMDSPTDAGTDGSYISLAADDMTEREIEGFIVEDSSDGSGANSSDLFFFVEDGTSGEYSEFALTDSVGDYTEGDVVVYRLRCSVPPGVGVVVYVEAEGVRFDELNDYKDLPESRSIGDDVFELGKDGQNTLIYFSSGGYCYNLCLQTSDSEKVDAVLSRISEGVN